MTWGDLKPGDVLAHRTGTYMYVCLAPGELLLLDDGVVEGKCTAADPAYPIPEAFEVFKVEEGG